MVLVGPTQTQVLLVPGRKGTAHGNQQAAPLGSNKLHSRGHQWPCKQCLASCMVGHLETLCNSPGMCQHQGDPHTSPYKSGKCLLHSMGHTLGCHTGQAVVAGC